VKKILICVDWFSPGFRAGGPIKSIVNFANLLSSDYEIYIYTSDRDLGMTQPYADIELNNWNVYQQNIFVHYTSQDKQNKNYLKLAIENIKPNYIYINSIFSKHFSIDVLLVKKYFNTIKVILSPRGMLRQSALAFKPIKKKIFLSYARLNKLYNNVTFHATDSIEFDDIQSKISKNAIVKLISNCPGKPIAAANRIEKKIEELKIIFIGRIHPIKNVELLLKALQNQTAVIHCSLIGVLEDNSYWLQCQKIIEKLPKNITVQFLNEVEPSALQKLILGNHVLVLPTQGENFGHAIYEAFSAGRPVIISDQTPWRNLQQKKAGWDLQLNSIDSFTTAIEQMAQMNQFEYDVYTAGAHQLAVNFFNNSDIKKKYLELFS
jgi:glycosyltransferase involved in cell wall biosynthesis